MRVKRYVVDSMPDALEKIRIDLGKDAIILNTKNIKTGGFFGLFSKQQIEVIAATDEKAKPPKESKTTTVTTERPKMAVSSQSAKMAYQRQFVEPESVPQMTAAPIIAQTELTGSHSETVATQVKPQVEPVVNQNQPEVSSAKDAGLSSGEVALELRDMRQMFQKLLIQSDADQFLPESVTKVRDRLISQEIEEEIVSSIISTILKQHDQIHISSEEEVYTFARNAIIEALQKGTRSTPKISKGVKHAYFFGPTGVGKTTTIAKLAAECMLKEKRKVGFITSDTYRIAAVDQLKTYANILNVPLEVVFSPKEVEQALERLSDCDLILIDTAGRNYRNDEYVNGMKELLQFGETSENYLVLSLSTRYVDMKSIVTNFADIPSAKAIFTKADETHTYGSILNVINQFDFSLSYITTGQNVPDDIIVATPEIVAKMIVGEETYGA